MLKREAKRGRQGIKKKIRRKWVTKAIVREKKNRKKIHTQRTRVTMKKRVGLKKDGCLKNHGEKRPMSKHHIEARAGEGWCTGFSGCGHWKQWKHFVGGGGGGC